MNLSFKPLLGNAYVSPSQRTRVLTEDWVGSEAYCPACGAEKLTQYPNNHRATDFFCPVCHEDYELKSRKGRFGGLVHDGAYQAMIGRLTEKRQPNLLLLSYDCSSGSVTDFLAIPGSFLVPQVIERRKPLSPSARRAGWTGCNIRIDGIPMSARIFLVQRSEVLSRTDVLAYWRRVAFVRDVSDQAATSWLVSVMRCVGRIGRSDFMLEDVYQFEAELRAEHPGNNNIRAKIRQQLQILRDSSYLEFLGRGRYRLMGTNVS